MVKKACVAFGKGCPRSQIDCIQILKYFQLNGWDTEVSANQADLVLLSTCAVESRAENESIRFINYMQKKLGSETELIVFGCFPGVNKKRLRKYFKGRTLLPSTLSALDDIIGAVVPFKSVPDPHFIDGPIAEAKKSFSFRERAIAHIDRKNVKDFFARSFCFLGLGASAMELAYEDVYHLRIARGCPGECSYCAIRFAAGPLISKGLDTVVAEFHDGLKRGAKNFNLIAGDVGGYGQDNGSNIVDLLRELFACEKEFTLLLSEFNLRWFIKFQDEMIDLLSRNQDKVGFVMLPIQSGSTSILQTMNRGHSAEDAVAAIKKLKSHAPRIKLASHVMVGFPGETEKDFQDTHDFLHAADFNQFYVYKYADRPNTDASRMDGKIPRGTIEKRAWRLKKDFMATCKV